MIQPGYKKMMTPIVGELFKKHMVVTKVAEELGISYTFTGACLRSYFRQKSLVKCRKKAEKIVGVTFEKAHSSPQKIARTKKAFEVYKRVGTLERTSKILGVTRERVRQILEMGTSLGLFHYDRMIERTQKKKEISDKVTKEQATEVLCSSGKVGLTEKFGIDYRLAEKIVTKYHLNTWKIRREKRLKGIMNQYNAAVQHFGKHPSALDLQSGSTKMRQLNIDILRHLGGMEKFREDHGIKFVHAKKIHLPKRYEHALDYCKRHKKFIRRDLENNLGIGTGVAINTIRYLKNQGIVKKVGEVKKHIYYEVIK